MKDEYKIVAYKTVTIPMLSGDLEIQVPQYEPIYENEVPEIKINKRKYLLIK
jgi:hypothetical protein